MGLWGVMGGSGRLGWDGMGWDGIWDEGDTLVTAGGAGRACVVLIH